MLLENAVTIRTASLADTTELAEIYAYYVRNTAITFDYEITDPETFREKMKHIMESYPYLVAEMDGKAVGYAYAGPFVGRAAYQWSAELTVYVDPDLRGRGIGRLLYDALEKKLGEMGVLNLYACIGEPAQEDEYLTSNSRHFHEHMGYRLCGTFENCGYKFGRWYHMIWMGKMIGDHLDHQPPVRFPD